MKISVLEEEIEELEDDISKRKKMDRKAQGATSAVQGRD